jgi:hypothetical protein
MSLSFTDQDKVDIRRHMGFGALGDTQPGGSSLMFFRFFAEYTTLEYRMNNLLDPEIALVQGQYLPFLNQLEQDIYSVRSNLDTDAASVWTHNREETVDRIELYNYHRRVLCAFFQLPEGPFFVSSSGAGARFIV